MSKALPSPELKLGSGVLVDGDPGLVVGLNDVCATIRMSNGVNAMLTRTEAEALPRCEPPEFGPDVADGPEGPDEPTRPAPPRPTGKHANNVRVRLQVGARILGPTGYAAVTDLGPHTVRLEYSDGTAAEVPYGEVAGVEVRGDEVQAQIHALEPWWSTLTDTGQEEALNRLEIVLEIETGYRFGHSRLGLPGEPRFPFGASGASDKAKCERMAQLVTYEKKADRKIVRRLADGEISSDSVAGRTIKNYLDDHRRDPLRGLVSGYETRSRQGFDALDERVRAIADEVFADYDGTSSKVNTDTIDMRIRLIMKERGLEGVKLPEGLWAEYLSHRHAEVGRNTRQQRSRTLRSKASGHTSVAAMHPAGLLALDATRIDNLVWDPVAGKVRSCEVLTLINVQSRLIHGLRVTPRSGNALEAGLVLYDALRPMSMLVDGTTIHDWRWCGLPEAIDLSQVAVHRSEKRIVPPGRTLQGEHFKPGVRPTAIRCDHGSAFVNGHFIGLMDHFGIDLMLSPGKRPVSNAHVERWHETLQRAYQAIPGFKGRNVSERGSHVEHLGQALLTAEELERHLRRFVALDYHREPHDGLVLPGAEGARLTPLEMHDAMLSVTGRIDMPQHPDMIIQFLPVRWLTIGPAGVEFKNLAYDAPALDEFRRVRVGQFKAKTRKAPFFYDDRDASRLWWRAPDTGRIHEIPWRARHLLDLPLSGWIRDRALDSIKQRGGNTVLKRRVAAKEILAELGQLTTPDELAENRMYAERLRFERSQKDHAEAQEFASRVPQAVFMPPPATPPESLQGDYEAWPDYDEAS